MGDKSTLKLSFINQPWTIAAPPKGSDSTGIWSDQVSNHLNKYVSVVYYGCEASKSEVKDDHCYLDTNGHSPIEYRAISAKLKKSRSIPSKIILKLSKVLKKPYFGSKWFNYDYIWQIAQDVEQSNYTLIHIHNFSQFVPIIRDRAPNTKIVLHMHCEWVNRLEKFAIAPRLAQTDLILSCSNYITNKIKARFPEYAENCRTVNNGVNSDYFVPPEIPQRCQNAPQILFVGRISPEKGIHDLITAFIEVTKKYPQARLTIAGPHTIVAKELLFDLQPEPEVQALKPYYSLNYLEYIKSQIPTNLSPQVFFTNSLAQSELLPFYQNADVVVNPSLSEAFGMSLVEAMATETPVVATKIGGMTEIIDDGINGLLTEAGEPQQLADAICSLIADPNLARRMGKAGRTKVLQRYCWSKIAESLMDCYADIGVDVRANVSQKAVARSL